MILDVVMVVAGLALLLTGAEQLVKGASRLAVGLGIPPLIVGLTIVALGTSSPEMAISIGSALEGRADLAVGNVVGSNIANVLLILGVSATMAPLVVRSQLVRFDVPVMVVVSALVLWLALDGAVSRLDGLFLCLGLVGYVAILVAKAGKERKEVSDEFEAPFRGARRTVGWNVTLVAFGLGLLVAGSNLLVEGAVGIAATLGLSELVIGLTLVALGTSLPEVATSLVAVVRGAADIAAGNVVGSNILNLLAVLGLTGLLAPEGVRVAAGALEFDLPVMLAVAVACLPIFFTGYRIDRWEGVLFLGYYLAYVAFLILTATEQEAVGLLSTAMVWFVIPITVVTLVATTVHAWRRGRPDTHI